MQRPRAAGLTLVEVLIALAVFSLVGLLITRIWVGANSTSVVTMSIVDAQSLARTAMARLELDARSASRGSVELVFGRDETGNPVDCNVVNCEPLSDDLAFDTYLPNQTNTVRVWYYLSPDGELVRAVDGAAAVIARQVTNLEIVNATGESATIGLTVESSGRSAVITTGIAFRNP